MKKIYIDNPNSDQSIAIAKLIKKNSNIKTIGISEKKNNIKYFDKIISKSDFDFSSEINNTENYYLPTTAKETEYFLKKGHIVLKNIELKNNSLFCFNKIEFLKKTNLINIPTPKTYSDINEILSFPIFYKEKFERGGGVRGVALKYSDIPHKYKNDLIYQEYIEEEGTYGVAFIARNGKLLTYHCHFEKDSFPKVGGSAVYIENFFHPNLLKYTSDIVENIGYTGWGLAEFKFSRKINDFVIMEINSKMWASCEFSFLNNPKFLEILFGINIKNEHKEIKNTIFLNRFFKRGYRYVLKNFHKLFKVEKIIIYPNLYKDIINCVIPYFIIKKINKIRNNN
ncbi:hypothetical protein KKJ17_05135 [Xenorhabdus bovienii]|uniref:hypothetical protein n=1 Tax=Xenorhabdus bovienii TaxID=40576 RepID=UPI0023B225E7|nr:hypothetical protein [Xenorhabdus bovienii]MDE9517149.1 hypothetical protein [Xenorhabdus bovienii]